MPHGPTAVARVSGRGLRQHRLATGTALAEAPTIPSSTEVGTTKGGKKRRRNPPLTIEEERKLLMKIQKARVLRDIQKNLVATEGGDVVTLESWAQKAGLEIDELREALNESLGAKRTLVNRNMPMVMKIVDEKYRWRLRGGQLSTADLLHEGAYALGLAADRFDPAMPNRFMTYATYLVREKMDLAMAAGNMALSVPISALKELHKARRDLTAKIGRVPSERELASFFVEGKFVVSDSDSEDGIKAGTGDDVQVQPGIRRRRAQLLLAVQQSASLDVVTKDVDGNLSSMVDNIESDAGNPLLKPGIDGISGLLPKVLTRKQESLVRMSCGLGARRPLSMVECAKRMSLSVERTKALLDTSFEKLRVAATADDPRLVVYTRPKGSRSAA